jgi:hypothetical protein
MRPLRNPAEPSRLARKNGQDPVAEDHESMSESNRRNQIEMTEILIASAIDAPVPTLGLDIDGCIDEAPAFFSILTNIWPGRVVIVTYRDNRSKAEADLARLGIRYDELVLVDSFDAKAQVIIEKGVMVYVDDQPEMLKNIPETVAVMLFRNSGNFDYNDNMWMFSRRTGKLV